MINITICTVTMNNDDDLYDTLSSIEKQSKKPSVVIVKDGITRIPPLFISEFSYSINYLSSVDTGIYDAMNQALKASDDSYLLFLNSGDVLHSSKSIESLYAYILHLNCPDLLLTSWVHQNTSALFKPSLQPLYFSHQAAVYQKKLHDDLGPYITLKNFHSADYFFFMQVVTNSLYRSRCLPSLCLSSIDISGISNSLKTRMFVSCIRFIAGQENRFSLAIYALLHPVFYYLRVVIFHFFILSRANKK